MAAASLSSKGQITLPKEIRDIYGLEEGDRIDFVPEKGWIIMVPLKRNILDLYGSIAHKGKTLDFSKIREKIKKQIIRRVQK